MRKGNPRQEARPKTIESDSPILINSAALGKKDSLQILHVDDDVSLLEVSKQLLLMENDFEIESAISVDEAFQKMRKQTYDAIVSDYEMPLKNGLDFLQELKDQQSDIPFILFTGKGREEVVEKALNLGADSYINKNGWPEAVYCELANAIKKAVERKKSKQLLVESEIKYRTLVENSLQGILITKTSPLQLVFANSSMGKMLGYSTEELKSLSPLGVAGLIHDEDKVVFFSRLEKRLHGEAADSSLEFRAVRKNGSIVWLEAFANRIEYMGEPAVQGIFLDITERKKAQEILLESNERYRELANSLPDFVFETDAKGTLIFVNDRAFDIAGYSHEEFEKGLNILEFVVPEERERAMKNIQKLLAGDSYISTEYTFIRKDGTTFPVLVTATPCISRNKMTGLRGLAINITERKKAEEEIESSKNYLKTIIESVSTGIMIIDAQTHAIVDINPYALDIIGASKEQATGKICHKFVCPAEIGKCPISDLGQVVDKSERTLLSLNGEKIPILKTVVEMNWKGQNYLVESFVNITDRKKAEETLNRTMNELVRVNEKLGVVGSLTRHDVRNKLSVISGNIYLVKKKHSDCADIMDRLGAMEQACKSIERIFDFAKMYEEIGVEELSFINVETTIDEAVGLFSGSPNVKIINECHGLTVLADSFLRQLYYNLIDNSIKHGKKVTNIRVHYEKADQDKLDLIYEDDGIGIPDQNKPQLFKEGFSTGGSSGYGLYLIKKMMEVYNWTIQENGKPNKGAKFTITIPKLNQKGKNNFQINLDTTPSPS
ncbi:MAG: PAS domain S-box protein [Candidatus Bathyarchaeia archaeon]|jgi:PAS domain S-box-containing protein